MVQKVNNNKIAFISCVNNEMYYEECCRYINRLIIPSGYEIDIIGIREASSMAEGYNAAMRDSDAKYKVYLHQDVFIENTNFIADLIKLFTISKAGLVGMVGTNVHSESARYENEWTIGDIKACNSANVLTLVLDNDSSCEYREAIAVDGMLIATQYDVEWDEMLGGWHFYDIAICERFKQHNYAIVVPFQEKTWAFHDAGFCSKKGYDEKREQFCNLYEGYSYDVNDGVHYDEISLEFEKEKKEAINCFDMGNYTDAVAHTINAYKVWSSDTELSYMSHLLTIWDKDKTLFSKHNTLSEETALFQYICFLVKRIECSFDETDYIELIQAIADGKISQNYLIEVLGTYSFNPQYVWDTIKTRLT